MKIFVLKTETERLQRKSSSEFRIESRDEIIGVFNSVTIAQIWINEHTLGDTNLVLSPVSYGVLGNWYQTQQIITKGSSLIDNTGLRFILKEYQLNDKETKCATN